MPLAPSPEKSAPMGEMQAGGGGFDPATRAMLDNQASAERVSDIYAYLPITTVAMVVGVIVTVAQYWSLVPRAGGPPISRGSFVVASYV